MKSHRSVASGLWVLSSVLIVAGLRPSVEAHSLGVNTEGPLDPDVVQRLGLPMPGSQPDVPTQHSSGGSIEPLSAGLPPILNAAGPLSAALLTTVGGQNTQFSDVALIADWDGREDNAADREAPVDDFSLVEPEIDMILTRTAISEHTRANGFDENVYYYGDSVGNVWVGVDNAGDSLIDTVLQINLPTTLNAFGTILSDDQVVITGLAVNPVADLTSFPNVNSSFTAFTGAVGEILYVSYMDTGGGLRLSTNNIIVRSGVIAFPIADVVSPAPAPPGVVSALGFPVTVGGAFGVAFSVFHNFAGLAVDDDGSVYFQQVDLQQFTGANIVKITDVGTNQDRSLATNGFPTLQTLNPALGNYGNASGPAAQVNRFTNYSGTSTTFGNIASLATGPCNVLYAALAKSNTGSGNVTEGLFPAAAAFAPLGTPSMIISFADTVGAFDTCSAIPGGISGEIPVGDGFADIAAAGLAPLVAGVNNFRVYVHGNGPDLRSVLPADNKVTGNTENTLKLDLQVDFTIHSGLVVNEADKLFVISGGTPAGVGLNPSARRTEILGFEDHCPEDRRGDDIDYRGDNLPNPPASGGNVGDGDSDRFDHIFAQAPVDGVSLTPTGLSGLARGFLRYTNRLAPNALGLAITLGQTASVQGDDATTGPIVFENLDPSHQVAGGDDQNTPFRGDDNDGAGSSVLIGAKEGGFEFTFGGPVGTAACVWNEFWLNSNGSITFGNGDTSNVPTVPAFRSDDPKIAPAWTDLNPNARAASVASFPVQALGFADVNSFRIRWINVPLFGGEACGSRNTFAITLEDDGTGIDENATQPLNPANPIGNNAVPFDLQEGRTDLHFETEPITGSIVGCPPRRNGTGSFCFEYCRMDLLGTALSPVLVGYSIGGLSALNPPGLCEIDLGEAARDSDDEAFGVIQGSTASIDHCLIGEGTEPTLYEFFNEGANASIGPGGTQIFAVADFDLRDEGNDPALRTPLHQSDQNQGRVCFFGISCAPPENAQCQAILPVLPVNVAPNQPPVGPDSITGIINALCEAEINIVGCGFFPNEITNICPGVPPNGGPPVDRPGKVVTTAISLSCDSNNDGIFESTTLLGNVTPVSENLITAKLLPLTSLGFPGTPFPLACCGGAGLLTITTTFTAGDNNVFGPFTRTTTCFVDLGVRAPVVLSVTGVSGDCSLAQDLLISGACFVLPQGNVSRVFAVEFNPVTQTLNPANTIDATTFVVLNPNLIDAFFNFGAANAGKTFMIFVTGPGGTSRNLTLGQTPAGCVFGNEQGIQVTFNCQGGGGGGGGNPSKVVTIVAKDATASEPGTDKGTFKVTRTGSLSQSLLVKYSLGGTATMGADYSNLSGQVTIPIGSATANIVVSPLNDTNVECAETVVATVSPNAAYTVGSPNNATVTIKDNDLPVLTIVSNDSSASEPGSNTATLTVIRTGCTSLPLTFSVTGGGTAKLGLDFTVSGGTATIPAGSSSITYTITPVDDGVPEPPESIVVTLTAKPTYILGVPKTASITINDND